MKFQQLPLILLCSVMVQCTKNSAPLGSESNPIKMFFVPSVDIKSIEDNSKIIEGYLAQQTHLHFKVATPTSYVAVVEAMGTRRADIGALNTFGYLLANEKYQAHARLTVIRHGSALYQAQFIAKTDGPIHSIDDIANRKIAFVDPASASGYLLPLKILNDRHIKPRDQVFAMRHDSVVSMVYQGQVDAGATFYTPPFNGEIQDARMLVKTQYPDVEAKIKIVSLTDAIPNDPIVFRAEFPKDLEDQIVQTLVAYVKTPAGKDAFSKLYGVDDLKPATDSDYDGVRKLLKSIGKSVNELVK
jgi:phosphonate transport system substrate-binding protein